MNSSGIKRGLAVTAVAALGVVGIPGIAHADSTAYSVTLTPSSATAQAYQTVDFSGVAKSQSGSAVGGDTVTIKLAETTSSSTVSPFYVDSSATVVTAAAETDGTAAGTYNWTETVSVVTDTATATLGNYSITVGSKVAGTVNLTATDGGSANAKLTVTGTGSNDADDVTGLSVTSGSSITAYQDASQDAVDPVAVTLKSTGAIVPLGAANTLGGSYSIATAADPSTSVKSGYWGGAPAFSSDPYSKTVDLSAAVAGLEAGSYVVTFWDNQDSNATNTAGVDAGEPKATASLSLVTEPTWAVDSGDSTTSKYEDGVAYYGTATDFAGVNDDENNLLPDDAAVTIPLAAQVVGDGATTRPAAGTKFWFDVAVDGNDPVRVAGTYDATTGLVTGSYAATKDDAATDGAVVVSLAVSQSSTAGDGDARSLGTVSTFAPRDFGISQLAGADSNVQATAGGSVSIPVQVVDQFGKAKAGDVLSFTVTSSDDTITTSTTAPATDSTGRTTITYTDSPAATVGATETVNATDSTTTGVDPLATVTVKYIAGTTTPAAITDGTATGKPADPYTGGAYDTDTNGAWETGMTVSAEGNSVKSYSFTVVNAKGEPLSNSTVTLSAVGGQVEYNGKIGSSLTAVTNGSGVISGVTIGSEKIGTVALTVTDGAASYSFKPLEVTEAGDPYSIVPVTTPQTITPGDSAKFVFEVTDMFGNAVEGADVAFSLGSNTAPGTLDFVSAYGGGNVSDKNGDVVAVLDTTANDLGTGAVTASPNDSDWVTAKDDAGTATFTDPAEDAAGVSIAYTVEAPEVVTPPTKPAPVFKLVSSHAKSVGNKDVITVKVANAKGKVVKLVKAGKVLKTWKVNVNGNKTITFRVKDANGKKVTKYVVKAGPKTGHARTK